MRFRPDSQRVGILRAALARRSRLLIICFGAVVAVIYRLATRDVIGATVFLVGFFVIGMGSGSAVAESKIRRLLGFEYDVNDACVRRFSANGESQSIEWMNVAAFSIRSGRFGSIDIKARDGRVFYIFYPDTYVTGDECGDLASSLLRHLSGISALESV